MITQTLEIRREAAVQAITDWLLENNTICFEDEGGEEESGPFSEYGTDTETINTMMDTLVRDVVDKLAEYQL